MLDMSATQSRRTKVQRKSVGWGEGHEESDFDFAKCHLVVFFGASAVLAPPNHNFSVGDKLSIESLTTDVFEPRTSNGSLCSHARPMSYKALILVFTRRRGEVSNESNLECLRPSPRHPLLRQFFAPAPSFWVRLWRHGEEGRLLSQASSSA